MVIAVVHLAATAAMVGLIWFVQVVHYPSFHSVDDQSFVEFEVTHQRRTTAVVGLPMTLEGVTGLWLFADPPGDLGRTLPFVSLVVLAVVLASTVLVQVPMHGRLGTGEVIGAERARVIDQLVRTNWIRTLGWTLRGVLGIMMVTAVGGINS